MHPARLPSRSFTVDDLFELPDVGKRYEIYGGHVQMVPPPSLVHQHASKELQYILTRHIKAGDLGELFNAPFGLILDTTDYTEPDLAFVSRERLSLLTARGVEGPPDLVVEILSPPTKRRDIEVKSDLYARYGVDHYWILDPMSHRLQAYTRGPDGAYRVVAEIGPGGVFRPVLFPGLDIPLDSLWPSWL
jgi:Uma2 family endonuclease